MKRTVVIAFTVFAASAIVMAQGRGAPQPPPPLEPGASQADVDAALVAAPGNLKDQATVVKWTRNGSTYSYTTLRKGTNRLVCYDRSGFPMQQPYSIECTNLGNLDRVKQNMEVEALGDRAAVQAKFDELEKSGQRVKPEFGSIFYHAMGMSKDNPRSHMTIAVPGATTASLGLPENGRGGGVWIMNAGTTTAHLMIPGESRRPRVKYLFVVWLAGAALAAPATQTFTGVITDSMCGAAGHASMRMGPTDAECTVACVQAHGSLYVLLSGKTVYELSNQQLPEKFAGAKVKVTGTLDAKTHTITVNSISPAK